MSGGLLILNKVVMLVVVVSLRFAIHYRNSCYERMVALTK